MAGASWMRVDADLPGHPKVRRLCREAGVDTPTAVGLLVTLWCWALRYAADGDLSGYDAGELEDSAGWQGEPGRLAGALEVAGFVDRGPDGGLALHDWGERNEKVAQAAALARERVRRHRARGPAEVPVEGAEPVTEASSGACNGVTRYSVTGNAGGCNGVTLLRNDTVRNETTESSSRAGAREAGPGSEPEEPELEAYREAVLELHPRPGLPVELERELFAARASLPPLEAWRASLEAWAACEEWRDGYAPAAGRWIRGRGWRSRPPAPRRRAGAEVSQLGPRPVAPPAPELDVAGRVAALESALPAALPGRAGLCEGLAMAAGAGASHGPEAAERMLEELESGYLGRLARGELGGVDLEAVERVVATAAGAAGGRVTAAALEALRSAALAEAVGLPKLSLFAPREVTA
ncbi:MAG: hypothetical protein BWX64_02214 [Acidobacteria bacterium ADurb.Bin051]|jgi:hypothetical protein|nr:MAG: hypothetical protein BWX64_02214 [Acidobacteria bacterium ADurb.Bin051]